MSSSDQIISPP